MKANSEFYTSALYILIISCCCCCARVNGLYPPRSREGQLLEVMMPKILLEEFTYVPTREGYRYSYKLPDGTTREEVGLIVNPDTPNADLLIMGAFSRSDRDSITTTMFTADKNGFRPRMNVKNRKLSPKSLQSLAG